MIQLELRDYSEFRRLRNYYRRNFHNGISDEAFVIWCEDMCDNLRQNEEEIKTKGAKK